MMDRLIELENVSYSYGKNKVLDKVSCFINKGDYTGIIGPNGSAKSTTMKLMLGLLKADEGDIRLLGEDIKKFNDYEAIGYISQNVRDFNKMFPATVEEIVSLNSSGSIVKKEDKDKVREALDIVGMYEFKDRKIGNLSGGQKQRVFIARGIVNRPKILFMDEPLVGVDVESQDKFYRLMDRLNKDYGMTLVMVTHDIDIVAREANRLICLDSGSLYSHDSSECDCVEKIKEIYGESMEILLKRH